MTSFPLWFETEDGEWTRVDIGSPDVMLANVLPKTVGTFVYGALDLGWDQAKTHTIRDLGIPPDAMISMYRDFWMPTSTTLPLRLNVSLANYARLTSAMSQHFFIGGEQYKRHSQQKTTQQLFHLIFEYAEEYSHKPVMMPWFAMSFCPSHMSVDQTDIAFIVPYKEGGHHILQTKLSSVTRLALDDASVIATEKGAHLQDLLFHHKRLWVLYSDRICLYRDRRLAGEWMSPDGTTSFASLACDPSRSDWVHVLDTDDNGSIITFEMIGTSLIPIRRRPLAQSKMSRQTRFALQSQHVVLYDPMQADKAVVRAEVQRPHIVTHRFPLAKPRGRHAMDIHGSHGRAMLWVDGDDDVVCVDNLPMNNTTTLSTMSNHWHSEIYRWSSDGGVASGPWRMRKDQTNPCALIDRVKGGFMILYPYRGGTNDPTVRGGMFLV